MHKITVQRFTGSAEPLKTSYRVTLEGEESVPVDCFDVEKAIGRLVAAFAAKLDIQIVKKD